MRVLFVVPYVPSRIRVRPYEFIRALAERHEVTVVCLVTNASEQRDVANLRNTGIVVHAIPHPRARAVAQVVWRGAAGASLQVAYAASQALARTVERLAPQFDLVHLEHLRGTGEAFNTSGVPVVWDAVDCITLLLSEMSRGPQPAHVRALQRIESPRTTRHEAAMLQRFTQIVVTAPRDASVLQSLNANAHARVSVVPNGVDLSYFTPRGELTIANEVLFTGKMSYHANRIAVQIFAETVWPRVRETHPDARFIIAGQDPPGVIRRLDGNAGITVTGYVPDMRPYLARAALSVAPLVYSVGNPNKVLEAMAMGVPVVATPAAVTSLNDLDRTGIVVSEMGGLADTITQLLATPAERARRGKQGRAYVETERSWQHAVTALDLVYEAARREYGAHASHAAVAAD